MRKLKIGGIVLMTIALLVSVTAANRYREKMKVAQQNENALLSGIKEIQKENEAYGVQVNTLELSLKQYKEYRAEDVEKIKSLGVKLKNLESVAKHYAEINAELEGMVKDTTVIVQKDSVFIEKTISKIRVIDPFIQLEGWVDKDKFNGKIHIPATLTQTIEAEYKHKFLWWRWGLKGFKQKMISDNPYVKIKYSEFIKIKK